MSVSPVSNSASQRSSARPGARRCTVGNRLTSILASGSSSSHGLLFGVKTTAYTHTEADHLPYGIKSAIGTDLKYGTIRSAAADWSVYPVGTTFKIQGEPYLYEVDDYGSALVGTRTIDLYKPSLSAMNSWGARHVNINVIHWGSVTRSLAILKPRERKKGHIHAMVTKLESGPEPSI